MERVWYVACSQSEEMSRHGTLVDLFEETCGAHAERPALGSRRGDGWSWITYDALRRRVDHFRAGLASLGLSSGDRLAIVSDNRVEWAVAAYAAYGLGAAVVPLYEKQRAAEWEFILGDSEATVLVAGTSGIAETLGSMRRSLPALRAIVSVDGPTAHGPGFADLAARGAGAPVAAVQPGGDTTATIIYTSGTTGKPKGVVLSHRNIASNVDAGRELFEFTQEDRSLSFIPWAHAFGHTCELHTMLSIGASIGINDAVPRLTANLAEVQPTILVAVPRVFNMLFARIRAAMAARRPAVQSLLSAAVRGAQHQHERGRVPLSERIARAVADPVLFSRVRKSLGGRLKYAVSGGASLAPQVAEFIDAFGIRVYEGYGLTETSPLVSANHPGEVRIGSVGKVIPGVTVRIDRPSEGARDGEIIVFGPNVMRGYHHRPEEQAKAFTPDGGFRTGDLGYLDADGYLYVTGRIKEQYKLENGKYVAPVPLEEQLQLSPFIANAVLYGANRPHNVALIALNVPAVTRWAQERGATIEDLAGDSNVRKLIAGEIAAHTTSFRDYERPRTFVLTTDDFTPENELLTPSLKLKRPAVMARYGKALESLYQSRSTNDYVAPDRLS